MWEFIKNLEISAKSYEEGFLKIADALETEFFKLMKETEISKYIQKLADSMRLWIDLLDVLR